MALSNSWEIIEFLKQIPSISIAEIQGVHSPHRHYAALGNHPLVATAQTLNVESVGKTNRKDGTPYADHPVRVALLIQEWFVGQWEGSHIEVAKACALVHDALEEGPGVHVQTSKALRDRLQAHTVDRASAAEVAFASVVLTEPGLDYAKLVGISDKATAKLLNKACLVHQICEWVKTTSEDPRRIAAVAVADKLVNLFDVGYLLDPAKVAPKYQQDAMAAYIGSLGFALEQYHNAFFTVADTSRALHAFLTAAMEALQVQRQAQKVAPSHYEQKVNQLSGLWKQHGKVLEPLIRTRLNDFHSAIKNS